MCSLLLGTLSLHLIPLGRPGSRWEDDIKMDLREIGREVANWIHMAQHMDQWRDLVKTVMNLRNS
jgi:hypothetical protein